MRVQEIENLTIGHVVCKIRSQKENSVVAFGTHFRRVFIGASKVKSYSRLLFEYSSRETVPITLRLGIHTYVCKERQLCFFLIFLLTST
jgi:hypothetical protein